jgi:hypothetical protein
VRHLVPPGAAGYGAAIASLLACPFCRELFPESEATTCPDCGVRLQPMEELPPSLEALAEEALAGEVIAPEERPLPKGDMSRGRGLLLVLSLLGIAGFFAPWVIMDRPEIATLSGFDLARGRAGWLWAGAVGWFILGALVWTRRTVAQMRGVRVIAAVFAAMTLCEVVVLVALPPKSSRYLPVQFDWGWGLWASGVVSLLGIVAAARFGGRLDGRLPATVHGESSAGETIH